MANIKKINLAREHCDFGFDSILNPIIIGQDKNGEDIIFASEREIGAKRKYCASYFIGAQWDGSCNHAFIVVPKIENIDFMEMFSVCFFNSQKEDCFADIYHIDFDKPRIEIDSSICQALTPILIVHFIASVEKIVSKGLMHGYIQRSENIKKKKGRILVSQNIKRNEVVERHNKFYCQYQEYSVDITENKLIKKALLISQSVLRVGNCKNERITTSLSRALVAFNDVGDQVERWQISKLKSNSIYKEYKETVELANQILRQYDYSITNASEIKNGKQKVPPFWINMPLLFEHYVLGILKKDYGQQILYQFEGSLGEMPDFLFDGEEKLILDTKYKATETKLKDLDIIGQLCRYSRDERILSQFDLDVSNGSFNQIIPCIFIYANGYLDDIENKKVVYNTSEMLKKENWKKFDGFYKFYSICINLPQKH